MSLSLASGVLLAFEGIDGSGKSTQVGAVARALRNAGLSVVTTREPTDGRYGQELRRSAQTGRLSAARELELFMLDRAEHVARLIQPSLAAGRVVITDRYYYSTVAYQGARGLDRAQLLRDNEAIAPRPDMLVVVDVPVAAALARIQHGRGEQPNAFEQGAMLEASRAIFLELARSERGAQVVDGLREEVVVTRDILTRLLRGVLGDRIDRTLDPAAAGTLKASLVTGAVAA